MSESLQPHRLHHARFTCPSFSLRVCSSSCSLRDIQTPQYLDSIGYIQNEERALFLKVTIYIIQKNMFFVTRFIMMHFGNQILNMPLNMLFSVLQRVAKQKNLNTTVLVYFSPCNLMFHDTVTYSVFSLRLCDLISGLQCQKEPLSFKNCHLTRVYQASALCLEQQFMHKCSTQFS